MLLDDGAWGAASDPTRNAALQRAGIRSLRLRLASILTARSFITQATAWAFAWGTAVLIARAVWQVDREPLLWGALGFVVVLVAATIHGLRSTPRVERLRALIDYQSRAGGLIMTAAETETGLWRQRMPRPARPALRWRARRRMGIFGAAAVFAAVSFLVPDRLSVLAGANSLDVSREVAELLEQIEILEEEKIVESEEAESWKTKLEQIRREASGSDPVKTWEALDHLQEKLTKTAAEAAEEAIQDTEGLTEAEALSQAVDQAANLLTEETLKESMAALKETLEPVSERLDKEALEGLGQLSPDLLAELRKLDEQLRQAGEESLAHLKEDGAVAVYKPAPDIKVSDLESPGSFTSHALLLKKDLNPAVFSEQPDATFQLDAQALGEGERVFELNNDQLRVFTRDPGATVSVSDLTPLDTAATDWIVVADREQQPGCFRFDEESTRKCQDACSALNRVARACKAGKTDIRRLLKALARARLVDRLALKRCENAGQCDMAALMEFETKEGQTCKSGELLGMIGTCRGGVTRGRGDAPMIWKDPSNRDDARFLEQVLPPSLNPSLDDTSVIGVSTGAPEVDNGAEGSTGNALQGADAGGGSAHTRTVLPRHRRAIQKYFERE